MSQLPKCPKCKKQTYKLVVVFNDEATADVIDGQFEFMVNSALPIPVRASAECSCCGHNWKIRNANIANIFD